MKRFTGFSGILVLALTVGFGAQGAARGLSNTGLPAGRPTIYVGSAIDTPYTQSATVPGLTAIFLLSEKSALQAYLGMPTINPFLIGAGFNYRYTLVGDSLKGFHIGAGLGLGAMNSAARTFYVNVQPLFGIHFEIIERVMLVFNSGLNFQVTTQAGALELVLGGNSPLMGVSLAFGL